MLDFFKTFGKGVLYIVLLPVFILILALWAIFSFGVFLFQLFKSIIIFFSGKPFFAPLPEETEANMRMNNMEYDPQSKTYVPIGQANKTQTVQQGNTTNILCQNLNVTPDQINNANIANQNPNYVNPNQQAIDFSNVNALPNNQEPSQITYNENLTIDDDNIENGDDNDEF